MGAALRFWSLKSATTIGAAISNAVRDARRPVAPRKRNKSAGTRNFPISPLRSHVQAGNEKALKNIYK
jgi:hypothetical protein